MIRRLIIDTCGPDFAKRYFLRDGQNNFWNEMGQAWTSNFQDATLWADCGEISQKQRDLMLSQNPGGVQNFVAPMFIEVKAEEPVDVHALRKWLSEAVQIWVDSHYGTGPGDSMLMVSLDWDALMKREDIDNEENS